MVLFLLMFFIGMLPCFYFEGIILQTMPDFMKASFGPVGGKNSSWTSGLLPRGKVQHLILLLQKIKDINWISIMSFSFCRQFPHCHITH